MPRYQKVLLSIGNAYVFAHRNGLADVHTRTNEKGLFNLPMEPGIYDVFVSAVGYDPPVRKIEITTDGMMIYKFRLEPRT